MPHSMVGMTRYAWVGLSACMCIGIWNDGECVQDGSMKEDNAGGANHIPASTTSPLDRKTLVEGATSMNEHLLTISCLPAIGL